MKTSTILTTTSLVAMLSAFGLIACGGAEVEPAAQAQSASLTGPAPAKPAGEAMRPGGPEHHRGDGRANFRGPPSGEKLLERFDANKNGVLEASELPERMQEHIGDIDTSGDGIVTKDELAASFKARFAERAKERFERRDVNHDGMLDASEVGEKWSKLSVADANGDQKLTPDELRAAFDAGKLGPKPGEHGHFRHGHEPPAAPAPAAPAK